MNADIVLCYFCNNKSDWLFLQMWSSWVEHHGYHYSKRKSKPPPYCTPRQRLLSFLVTAWSLLLTSSVRVATLAMKPKLVESWKCRVQHLRRYYSDQKHKQQGTSCLVFSSQFCYLPVLLMLWLLLVSSILLLAAYLDMVISTST